MGAELEGEGHLALQALTLAAAAALSAGATTVTHVRTGLQPCAEIGGYGTISRIDQAGNTVVETVRVGGSPFVPNEAFGGVWAPDNAGRTVGRMHLR